MSTNPASISRQGPTRRRLLLGGGAAGVGVLGTLSAQQLVAPSSAAETQTPLNGEERIPFFGDHQAGITTAPQAHALFVALTLARATDGAGLKRMFRLISDDAARLTQGQPALADTEPELAQNPARLTITFGVSRHAVQLAGKQPPNWLKDLPAFSIDRLEKKFSGGDIFIQFASDDPLIVAHASRMILKDARRFASIAWSQRGFRRAHGSVTAGTTMRNLFGQVDGTSNPQPSDPDFDALVWEPQGWLRNGSSVVVRKISMDLDKWDELDRSGREQSVGRYLSNGAPLTSSPHDPAAEFEVPNFEATTAGGLKVIPEFSHVARSRSAVPGERILRRSYNYDDAPTGSEVSNAGLIFISYQADVDRQYVPLQHRLDELDLLNQWTTPIGSAVFAILPGCHEGGFVGETLFG
ncbi:dye decolorizing peroxidase [Neomicrococcus aestuarii]|uniref:Dye decolorizing peroxidase n=1 Tax=Neomicrococcus aestuarii TaxID=556325 RepID=A0A7W8TTF8_9MICC|nr:Dyp-type peroxidase [Neomicrococcus aestuarii]MBB5511750.1 dye decolorizing peroxidase [Neomicrococcus aestuarii]